MRRAGGYAVSTSPLGTTESDSFTCFHCNRVVFVKPKEDPANIGGMCKQCMKLTCPACTAKGTCTPWEKKMERMEASYHARRSYGLI